MNLYTFFLFYINVCLDLAEYTNSYQEAIPLMTKECNCGERSINSRIVGGTDAEAHEFPWQVAMLKKGILICGASLINDRYVLSAAHCFKGRAHWDLQTIITVNLDDISFEIGTNHIKRNSTPAHVLVRRPIKTVLHGFYNPYTKFCDIAVSKLDTPIKDYTFHIMPICLPPLNRNFNNLKATVIGWGETRPNALIKGSTSSLKKTKVEILPEETCNERLLDLLRAFDSSVMLCASAHLSDSCQGDSGGPLSVELKKGKHFQIGVVSHGIGCANEFPGAYTRVEKFTSWILIHTSDGIYCDK